ncbi:MAG: SDR family oxidoreductase [Proteobacteria bacterium]|nr:SDR family oxidoreductase [Pseudomonadota bacterium]
MIDLKGKVALITGGSRGIGAEIVKTLARCGADVAFNYVKSEEKAISLKKDIEKMGSKVFIYKCDVVEYGDAENMVKEVVANLGGLHILVCNAGVNWDGVLWKMTPEQWHRVISVDLTGTFNFMRAVAPIFKDQGYGKIVNITSINGLRGKFGQTNYSAAKSGVHGLTKAAAKDLGKFGVNVNAIAPGFILTEMGESMPDEFKKIAIEESALKRAGLPEDVANLTAFLASDLAKHITGEIIKVDGGQYI